VLQAYVDVAVSVAGMLYTYVGVAVGVAGICIADTYMHGVYMAYIFGVRVYVSYIYGGVYLSYIFGVCVYASS